jgi:hypothetical protein
MWWICDGAPKATSHPRTEPWVALSAIALKTDSLRIGPMIAPLSQGVRSLAPTKAVGSCGGVVADVAKLSVGREE